MDYQWGVYRINLLFSVFFGGVNIIKYYGVYETNIYENKPRFDMSFFFVLLFVLCFCYWINIMR